MKYIKKFKDSKAYQSYINGTEFATPSINFENDINKINIKNEETRVIAQFETTEDNQELKICYSYALNQHAIKSIEIDGEQILEFAETYTFPKEGKHIVKYELNNETSLPTFAGTDMIDVRIPNNIKSFESGAFANTTKLKKLIIPNTVTSIKPGILSGSTSCKKVIVGRGIKFLESGTFYGSNSIEEIKLHNTLQHIGNSVFGGCTNLKSIKIPNSVKYLGQSVFEGCIKLESLIIGDNVESLEPGVIQGCTSLSYIKIGKKIKEIGSGIFGGSNSSLKKLIIPENVKTIKIGGIYGCPNLEELILEGIENIESSAISLSKVKNIKLPRTLKNFKGNSLTDMVSLENITIDNDNPYFYSFDNMIFSKDNTSLLLALKKTSISLNNNIISLGDGVFDLSPSLKRINSDTDGVFNLPNVTTLGTYTFYNNTYINELNISSSISAINDSTFYNCSNLKRINSDTDGVFNLPNVTTLGNNAFRTCQKLNNLIISNNIDSIPIYAFYSCMNLKRINSDTDYVANLPNVDTLGQYAFYYDYNLNYFTISSSITSLPNNVFQYCYNLKRINSDTDGVVNLPNVTSLGNYVFNSNTYVQNVILSSSLSSIGNNAFESCYNLKRINSDTDGLINIPNVTSLGNRVFYSCAQITNINISNSITQIPQYLCYGCTNLTEFNISNTVTKINLYAFYNCSGLTTLDIPDSITSIDTYAFYGCSKLKTINLNRTTPPTLGANAFNNVSGRIFNIPSLDYTTASNWASWANYMEMSLPTSTPNNVIYYKASSKLSETTSNYSNGIHTNKFGATLVSHEYVARLGKITFDADVTILDNYAFYGSAITEIILPDTITTINNYAFSSNNLKYLKIPKSVSNIQNFGNITVSELEHIEVDPDNQTYDSRNNCNAIIETATNTLLRGCKNTTIPNTVTSINEYAFYKCYYLTSDINIPNSVTSIGQYAFCNCPRFSSLTIGNGVTSIGAYAFNECYGLTSITMGNSVTSIGENSFYKCEKLTSITLPNSVTSIGNSAFFGCSALTSITLPDSVISVGNSAFNGCEALTSITIGDSLSSIGTYAFNLCLSNIASITVDSNNQTYNSGNNCNAVIETATNTLLFGCKNTTIPNTVTSIAKEAFYRCTGLTSITLPDSLTSIGESAFSGCAGLTSITLPDSVITIGAHAFSGCTLINSITLSSSLQSFTVSSLPPAITSISVNSNNTTYDSRDNCNAVIETATNKLLFGTGNTIIPNSITSIGESAFSGCTELTSITIPNSVTTIGAHAFRSCTGLTSITIPDSVTTIETQVFSNCTNLTNVVLPNTLTSLGTYVFNESGITSINIPSGLKTIDRGTFYNCKALTSITIPNTVTAIKDNAFNGTGLTSINIPSGITTILQGTFSSCKSLVSVTISAYITSIDAWAFAYCTSLTSITIKATTPPWLSGTSPFGSNHPDRKIYVPAASVSKYKSASNWSTYASVIEAIPTT